MKNKYISISLIISLLVMTGYCKINASAHVHSEIIPAPVEIKFTKESSFILKSNTNIYYEDGLEAQADYLKNVFRNSTGYELKIKRGVGNKGIVLCLDQKLVPHDEGYELIVRQGLVKITAHDYAGTFYGIQTLLQLFPPEIYNTNFQKNIVWSAAAVRVKDYPERPWRGMMLDVSRYFFDTDFIKKYIDMMAMYKLNVFHFHLVDDSGWRLEIKKYPRLTEIGAWIDTGVNPIGGYYTQEDIKEIVAFAAVRGVNVVPEIEFPAHMLSAIVAYPWLSCRGVQLKVPDQHYISRDLLCPGKKTSLQFISDVMDETMALFPYKYIHIGGDEAVYDYWRECDSCQILKQKLGLEKESELQGYLTNFAAEKAAEQGRTVVGWEILSRGEINRQVVSMIDSTLAFQTGHKAVLCPVQYLYFDFPESLTPGEVKSASWLAQAIPVEKVYSFPINDYNEDKSTTIGVQGCLWSDQFIVGNQLQEIPYLNENRSEQYAEYLTFPRLLALSEVAWGRQTERDYIDFRERMSTHFVRLENHGCNYRVPEPIISKMIEKDGKYTYTLKCPIKGRKIRYTIDGTYPTMHSPTYTVPVSVDSPSDFKASTFASNRHFSLPIYEMPDYSRYAAYGEFSGGWKPRQLQLMPSIWRFDCTNHINGNGHYEMSFLQTKGNGKTHFGKFKLLKGEEVITEKDLDTSINKGLCPVVYELDIDSFEPGISYSVEIEAYGEENNDSSGLVFTKKL